MSGYEAVEGEYLAERRLQKSAGALLLWGLGVGYVISGDCRAGGELGVLGAQSGASGTGASEGPPLVFAAIEHALDRWNALP